MKKLIIIDGLWASGKGYVFKQLINAVDCIPSPYQDGILDRLLKMESKSVCLSDEEKLNIIQNYQNINSDLSFTIPVKSGETEDIRFNDLHKIDYPSLFGEENITLEQYLNTVFGNSEKPYVIIGNGGMYHAKKLERYGIEVFLIHVNRSGYSSLKNLLSRKPIGQSPVTEKWSQRNYLWYLLRGYHALSIYKNVRLDRCSNLAIKWGGLEHEVVVDGKHIYLPKPNDIENDVKMYFYVIAILQLPLLLIRVLLKRD